MSNVLTATVLAHAEAARPTEYALCLARRMALAALGDHEASVRWHTRYQTLIFERTSTP